MNTKTVAIVGYGYVGKAVAGFFEKKFPIVFYDPPQGHTDREAVNNADLAVVCVPTPASTDGSVDLSYIEETFSWLRAKNILIKSTVPPGTTKKLSEKYDLADQLVFSPEYIGEGNYHVPHWKGYPHPTDMALHDFYIFGGSKSATSRVISFFTPIGGAHKKYIQTDSTTAELVKYMINSYLASKVTFSNEFFDIAKAFGVEYTELRELFGLDGRVDLTHTIVFPDNRGFGGKCLPKDIQGIITASAEAGYDAGYLKSIVSENKRFRGETKN